MFRPYPIRILVADSEPPAVFGLRAQLNALGYLVVAEATDSQQVVSLARDLRPDVAVIDVERLDMDGLEATERIDQERLCAIILLGECSTSEWVRAACSLTAVQAYLVKPVSERDLEPAVELALARFRQIERLEWEMMRLRTILGARSTLAPAAENAITERDQPLQKAQERIQRRARVEKAGMERAA